MILHTQPKKPWNKHDFLLLEAYQILEDERCPQCGLPVYICHNEDENVQFDVDEDTCAAKVEVERHEAQASSVEGYKPPLGTVMRPKPFMVDGADFSTLRIPYYKARLAYLEATSA